MVVNIDSIKSTVQNVPAKVVKGTDELGAATIKYAKQAKDVVKAHTPENLKDTFTSAANVAKNNKNKVAGVLVILAALTSLISIVKGIGHKIKGTDQV